MNLLATETVQHFSDLNFAAVAIFVAFGAGVGYVVRSIPIIRWVFAVSWLYVAIMSPILIAWQTGWFWMAWSSGILFVLRWKNKFMEVTTFDLAIPSSPHAGYRVKVFFRGLGKGIWWLLKMLWKLICAITFFICITLPEALMRLAFWLTRTIPKLKTAQGWWLLIKGILTWFWYLLPFQLRAEWSRLKHGKSVKDSFQEDMNRYWNKEREKQKRREERELKNSFRRLKKLVKKLAQKGVHPEEFARQCEEEERQKQSEQTSSYQQSSSTQSESTSSSNNFQEEHRRRTQAEKERQRQRSQQSSQHSSQSSQSSRGSESSRASSSQGSTSSSGTRQTKQEQPEPKPKPKPQPKEISPLSKEFYDKHRESFVDAGWEYEASEERFLKYDNTRLASEARLVFGVSSDADKSTMKKAYRKLAKIYMNRLMPYQPIPVQERADAIMKVINNAKTILID